MLVKKFILCLIITSFTSLSLYSQNPEGEYYTSDFAITLATLHTRKDLTIRATLQSADQSTTEVTFNPIASGSAIYECDDRYTWRLEVYSEYAVLKKMDDTRLVLSEMVLAKDKKTVKAKAKELNFNSKYLGLLETPKNEENRGYYIPKNPTSDFHTRNVNKIVFFSEKQVVGNEDTTKITTSFKIGEPVWAIAYLALPFKSEGYEHLANRYITTTGNSRYWLRIGMEKLDNDYTFQENIVFGSCPVKQLYKDDLEKNYVEFQVIPTPESNELDADEAAFIAERISVKLGSYTHTIQVSLATTESMQPGQKLVSGEFVIDASAGVEMYKTLAAEMANQDLMKKQLPVAVMHDKDLEEQMLLQIRSLARARGWADVTFYEARITLPWQVINDNYGGIKGMYIEADFVYKNDEGCGYMNFGFLREYLGNGNYSDAIRQYTTGERGAVHCDKILK